MTNGESSFKIISRKYYGNDFMGGFFMSGKMLVTQDLVNNKHYNVWNIIEDGIWRDRLE